MTGTRVFRPVISATPLFRTHLYSGYQNNEHSNSELIWIVLVCYSDPRWTSILFDFNFSGSVKERLVTAPRLAHLQPITIRNLNILENLILNWQNRINVLIMVNLIAILRNRVKVKSLENLTLSQHVRHPVMKIIKILPEFCSTNHLPKNCRFKLLQ